MKRALAAGGKPAKIAFNGQSIDGSHVEWGNKKFTWAVVDDPDGNHIELINYE